MFYDILQWFKIINEYYLMQIYYKKNLLSSYCVKLFYLVMWKLLF